MKPFVRYIALCCSVLLVLCGTASCIFDRDYGDPENDGTALFVLHIAPVSTRAATDGVTEKIRSLRIIAISKDDNGNNGVIEINRKVDFNDVESSTFGYALTWKTQPGKKDFYIFANEESVENIQFTDNRRPAGLGTNATLGDLLDRYADKDAAEEFKTIINSVYFSPKYRIQNQEIFLPYSVFYGDVDLKGGSPIEKTMYLVPVATKFTFCFQNYRTQEVEVKEIKVSPTHSQNFLLGRVAENEQTKPFNSHPDEPEKNETLYWVDWLAKVADETHKNLTPDNSTTNDQYGWISGYSMPGTSEQCVQTLIGTGPDLVGGKERKAEETIPGGSSEDTAGALYLGPYYFPESRYTAKDDNNTEQRYTLGLKLHDTEVDSSTSNDFEEGLVIENVRSLFRDTCVLIQISMRKGDVDVYAEMAPWEHQEVDGWADGGSIIP